jgi:hypothetical protein
MADYVVPAKELILLKDLPADHPQPVNLEWVDRGRNTRIGRTQVLMLLRTINSEQQLSPSVRKLHEVAGLRFHFVSETDRLRFKAIFDALRHVKADG